MPDAPWPGPPTTTASGAGAGDHGFPPSLVRAIAAHGPLEEVPVPRTHPASAEHERYRDGLESQDRRRRNRLARGCRGFWRRGCDDRGRRRGSRGRRGRRSRPQRPARSVPAVPDQDERGDGNDHNRGCGQLRGEASIAREARDGAPGRRLTGRDRADPGHQPVRDRTRRGSPQRGSHLLLQPLVVVHDRDLPSSWASTAARRRRSA